MGKNSNSIFATSIKDFNFHVFIAVKMKAFMVWFLLLIINVVNSKHYSSECETLPMEIHLTKGK